MPIVNTVATPRLGPARAPAGGANAQRVLSAAMRQREHTAKLIPHTFRMRFYVINTLLFYEYERGIQFSIFCTKYEGNGKEILGVSMADRYT